MSCVRSRKAAEVAKEAAQKAVGSIRTFEAVVDLSSIIGMLEEIKRSQRSSQWALLPDRYASLRKTLIGLRQISRLGRASLRGDTIDDS